MYCRICGHDDWTHDAEGYAGDCEEEHDPHAFVPDPDSFSEDIDPETGSWAPLDPDDDDPAVYGDDDDYRAEQQEMYDEMYPEPEDPMLWER